MRFSHPRLSASSIVHLPDWGVSEFDANSCCPVVALGPGCEPPPRVQDEEAPFASKSRVWSWPPTGIIQIAGADRIHACREPDSLDRLRAPVTPRHAMTAPGSAILAVDLSKFNRALGWYDPCTRRGLPHRGDHDRGPPSGASRAAGRPGRRRGVNAVHVPCADLGLGAASRERDRGGVAGEVDEAEDRPRRRPQALPPRHRRRT